MAGPINKKRSRDGKQPRPSKKQKRQQQYHSESEEEGSDDKGFNAVDLMDSDDDIHNAKVDDVADDAASSSSEDEQPALKLKKQPKQKSSKISSAKADAQSAESSADDNEEEDEEEEEDDDDESDADEYDLESETGNRKPKSKRNDPNAFATSISKILSTKLATSKRADPVLSRSSAAHDASKAAVDSVLEARAKKHLREQRKRALEKGRVKDVLVATRNDATGEMETSTSGILENERRLRKVAQRGVVKLFNAVRAAQVKAAEAEKDTRRQGVIGINQREEKVNEMSKKGFLELIASGGGGLKKGGLEEA